VDDEDKEFEECFFGVTDDEDFVEEKPKPKGDKGGSDAASKATQG